MQHFCFWHHFSLADLKDLRLFPGGPKTSRYLVLPPFASRSAIGLLCTYKKVLDLWVQLVKNGVKNKSVAFIILFSVYKKL